MVWGREAGHRLALLLKQAYEQIFPCTGKRPTLLPCLVVTRPNSFVRLRNATTLMNSSQTIFPQTGQTTGMDCRLLGLPLSSSVLVSAGMSIRLNASALLLSSCVSAKPKQKERNPQTKNTHGPRNKERKQLIKSGRGKHANTKESLRAYECTRLPDNLLY